MVLRKLEKLHNSQRDKMYIKNRKYGNFRFFSFLYHILNLSLCQLFYIRKAGCCHSTPPFSLVVPVAVYPMSPKMGNDFFVIPLRTYIRNTSTDSNCESQFTCHIGSSCHLAQVSFKVKYSRRRGIVSTSY